MKITDRVLVVTGGGSGIGRALVLHALDRGARVAALDVRPDGLDELAARTGAGDRLSTHVVDVSDRAAVQRVPEEVITRHGQVDGVIHNAGIIQPFVRFVDLDHSAMQHVIDVNLYGTIHVTKAFLPHLLARPAANLTVVSSAACFLPLAGQGLYGATKAAVKLLTEALQTELMETRVQVCVVFPGSVSTDIASNSGVDMGERFETDSSRSSATTADDAARIILSGIEKGRRHIPVGPDARFLSIASRVAPRLTTLMVHRRLKALLP